MSAQADELYRETLQAFRPPARLRLSEWADRSFYLSPENSADAGRWHTHPYQRDIMDAVTDPRVTDVTVMKSARLGLTRILLATCGYYIERDPCPIMLVQPRVEDGERFSKEDIAPMLRDCPTLTRLVLEPAAKDSDNTILTKNFRGGSLSVVGANSPGGFRMVSRRVLLLDEVDAYPLSAGTEGDPVRLATRRTETYWNRKRVAVSTPGIAGLSRIEKLYLEGDQRRRYVPCPQCGHMDYLTFREESEGGHWMQWPKDHPEQAHFVCRRNGCVIEERHKREMDAAGEWRASAPFVDHASFWLWSAYSYSPNARWGDIAREFQTAKHEGPDALKVFVNTWLGETWRETGEAPDWERLYQRREHYPLNTVPAGVVMITGGIDVQPNRLVYEITGWAADKQSWVIDAGVIWGDTSSEDNPVWQEADALLERTWTTSDGTDRGLDRLGVDSGYNTQVVYNWVRRHPGMRVIATKGSATAKALIGGPSKVEVIKNGRPLAGGGRVWPLGIDVAKTEFYGFLRKQPPTTESGDPYPPGYCHFPELGEEYFKEITAEHLVDVVHKRTHRRSREWQVIPNRENHWLDCRVISRAMACLEGLDRMWKKAKAATALTPAPAAPPRAIRPVAPTPPPPPREPPRTAGGREWLSGGRAGLGRGNWLGRR